MNTHINRSFVVLVLLFVTACAAQAASVPTALPPTVPPPAQEVDSLSNAEIVQEMVARLNDGDLEGSLDFFTEDAIVYLVGMPPFGMEYYRGRDELRQLWGDVAANHFVWEIEVLSEEGDLVQVRALTWHDFTRELGVAPNEFMETYRVIDGKIIEYYSLMTEASLAKFKPALLSVMPMEPAPVSDDAPVSEIIVAIAGGTCSYQGTLLLQQGEVKITVDVLDEDRSMYALTAFTLDAEHDLADLMASTVNDAPPSWANLIFLEEIAPGKMETYTLPLYEGPVYIICWSQPPDLAIGNIGPFEVK
jgi:ketosteroid isomerase-like protein